MKQIFIHNVKSQLLTHQEMARKTNGAHKSVDLSELGLHKLSLPGSSKSLQPSTDNRIDTTRLPSATPNFNVVLGSAQYHEQKWLFFLKAAKHIIQSTTLNWGTGATRRLWSSTS